jgi:hypothetical protein
MDRRGTSIRVFLPLGAPEGLRIVERSNWTGVVLVASRADLVQLRERPEVAGPGVYLLIGRSEEDRPEIYIGEADSVSRRLADHVRSDKDFWNEVMVITTKDTNFNKASARWLESQLINLANAVGRCKIQNANSGAPVHLSEADEADMLAFLDDVRILMPILGLRIFEKLGGRGGPTSALRYQISGRGSSGIGYESPEGFIVLAGAIGPADVVPSLSEGIRNQRQQMIESGDFEFIADGLRLTRDTVFGSPSTAAALILGRGVNGRTQWKTADGRTLKEVQEAQIADEPLVGIEATN